MATAHAHADAHPDPRPFFLTPPPRHLAELRIDPAPSAVAFSAPCPAARKRRCLLPASSVRKRMLLELDPFDSAPADSAPAPTSSSTPPPPPSRTPSPSPPPSPMASLPATPSSRAGAFSFGPGLEATAWAAGAGGAGNMFAFLDNAPRGSDASSALSFLAPQGKPPAPTSGGGFAFLTAPERPKTPTGPTARGGFAFEVPSPERPVTPTGSNTSGGLSFLAPLAQQPLTPTGSSAGVGFFASLSSEPSLLPAAGAAAASWLSPEPSPTGAADSGGFAFFPTPGPACAHVGSPSSAAAKETVLPAGLVTPSFVFSAPRSPPPLRKSGGGYKRPRLHLRCDATFARRKSPRQWEEEEGQLTPPPQKVAKTGASATDEASQSSIMSGATARPCCAFFTSPTKAGKQEDEKAYSEASRSPARSRCTSPARPSSAEKANKPEQEVEVSSVAACSGAEVVVRVTCKCGVHKEFCFDHRP